VVVLVGCAGSMGWFLCQCFTWQILEATDGYDTVIFIICGLSYVTALWIIHIIVPNLEPAKIEKPA